MGHNNPPPPSSSSTPSLAAFIRSYADGPSPACELQYTEQDGSFKVTASNAAFTRELEKDLIDALRSSIQEKVIHVNSIRWSVTALESDSESDTSDHRRSKTLVCMGTPTTNKTEEKVIPRDATSEDKPAQEAYSQTKQPRHYSSSTSTSEEWLQQWSKMHVPGFERQALLDHIDLIRKVDWSKTPLGPMDTWSIVLLSTLGQALASAFPVLLAWGPELTQIYNLPYSFNIAQKHPRNMGLSYAEAWPEVWEFLKAPTSAAMNGTATHVNNAQMFLQRKDYLEECYFTWSMTPVYDDNRQIAGIYIPNFDNTLAVVTERRLKLLRDASQALTIETKPVELYRRICKVTSKNPIDLPLLVFYDSSAADDEREMSEDSSDKLFEQSQFDATSQHDGGIGNNEINIGNSSTHPSGCDNAEKPQDDASMEGEPATEHSGGTHLQVPAGQSPSHSPTSRSPVASRAQQQSITSVRGRNNNDEDMRGQSDDEHAATEGDEGGLVIDPINKPDLNANLPPQQQHKAKPLSTFERAAYTGCAYDSKLFPPTIPPPAGEEDEINIATHPIFLQALRKVQTTHQHVVLQEEDIKPFTEYLDKTILGDQITTVVILPITTSDDTVRGICIVGLNPRKAYSEDYQVFLDLFQAQVNHGVTSIRLVGEELRRSRFFAALIKRKNDELHTVLDARTEELRSSQQKFVKMAEICPSGIWTVNSKGSVEFVNNAWWNITQHPRDRPPNDWPETIHPDDRERCEIWFKKVVTNIHEPIHPIEFRWKLPPGDNGMQRWTWADAKHDIGENGELVAITGTLTDITEKKLVELHQQQRAEEAIQMRRAQEGFIDMTSHELRNPLSAISLSSDATTERLEHLLNSDGAKTLMALYKTEVEDTLQDMKIINHCCVHMTRLIDDVLTLSKIDNQFLVITPVPCRPADFISETLAIFKGEMLSKDIVFEFEIKPSFAANHVDYVLTDPSRINQLVINILTNAIKFTAASKVRHIKVTLDCSPTKPTTAGTSMQRMPEAMENKSEAAADDIYLLVSISDTGRGLTHDEIGHLFQRFRQANPKTHISYGGSGLGLHICKRITELLGGEIGVESTRGKGSTFTFYIPTKRSPVPMSKGLAPSPGFSTLTGGQQITEDPLAKSSASLPQHYPTASGPLSSPAEESANSFEKLALLIVEDNLINQRLLDKHLTRVGCVTTCANHGQEAIDLIKQSKWVRSDGPTIDCVLMDIEMPVMDGLAAIQELRNMERTGELQGHIPVIAVTANARQEQLETMLNSGFDGTISKPFKIPIIMDRVRTLLREMKDRRSPTGSSGIKRKA